MERKIGYSDPFTIKVPHSGTIVHDYGNGLMEIPQDQLWEVTVRFLYVEDEISYSDSDYWSYNEKDNTVYVKINNSFRLRYLECMKKKIDGLELSREEELVIEDFEVISQSVSRHAAEKAMEQFEDRMKIYAAALSETKADVEEIIEVDATEPEEKKEYRTKNKAGDVAEIPPKMPLITNATWQNAMTYNDDDTAYLQPLSSVEGLTYESGRLMVGGLPATAAQIKHLYTKDNIENFDLPLLRVFYTVILNQFAKTWKEDKSVDEVITIYYPDLAKQIGKGTNISRNDVEKTINSILSFRNIIGITEKGNNILPVLVYLGEDREKNTISFASPYMLKVIKDLSKASVRKSKQGLDLVDKNGMPKMLPAYTYIPDMALAKEKNKKAVEIVCIVVTTIEQAGSHGTPHISAKTIIERNPLLKQSIDNATRISNKNTFLARSFTKAWELLRTKTDLMDRYKNIQLPDPKDKDFKLKYIPTMSTLDMVFEFPHEGKIRD